MIRNREISWRFFDSSSPHALHTSVATRCPVPGYLIEMQIVWWWHRRLVVVSPHCIPLICPSPHSEHAVPHHRWHTRCLGGALAPALACLHKDIPHPHGRMGTLVRNNFLSGRPKKMSKGPVDHTKKWVELWLAAVLPCRTPIGRLHVCYISQLFRESLSVSQQPPIWEPPSHSSMPW